MRCPSCKALTIILEYDRIEIDYCSSCGGIWLDSGELELIIGKEWPPFEIATDIKEKMIRCPKCFDKMAKVRLDPRKSLIIDKCGNGHGIWLDKGELETVINWESAGDRIKKWLTGIFRQEKPKTEGEPR
jgi:hypothetical protein